LILPTAAGGAGDISSRLVAQKLSERLGQHVIVENRAGASGVVGSVAVARAAPDGYTIGQVSASTHAASSVLTRNLPYDAVKDFAPISLIGTLPLVIAGYPGLPVRTIGELVAFAKSKPRSLNNAWAATLPYLSALLFCSEAGIELNHVLYKGFKSLQTGPAKSGGVGQTRVIADNLSILVQKLPEGSAPAHRTLPGHSRG
jgi:tripartite-type tricarboxylate transporter receptor subunit TctC